MLNEFVRVTDEESEFHGRVGKVVYVKKRALALNVEFSENETHTFQFDQVEIEE